MQILCDTNILIRIAKPDDPNHQSVIDSTVKIHGEGTTLVVVPQCLYEFYVVATRPVQNNGLGKSPADACQTIDTFLTFFRLLRDERSIFDEWQNLVKSHAVSGKNAHDARIAAAAIRHGVGKLLTLNPTDFKRFAEFQTVTPADILLP